MNPVAPRADTPNVRIRPTKPADLQRIFELQSDPESNAMAGTKPRSREVFFAAWEGNFANPAINSRVIEVGDHRDDGHSSGGRAGGVEIVGNLACFQADGRDCFGYWIARAHWGRGLASRAAALFLAEEHRRPLHATTLSDNARSRRVLEKCGFRFLGLRMGEETDRYIAREIAEFVLDRT